MTLDKTVIRGTLKMAYCEDLRLAAFQWADSKVVNCVSSYLDFRVATISRQIGPDRQRFLCPAALVHYQQNMGGVDKADQMRQHFGGFAGQSHFKKWYKKTLMAVLDCMLLNAWLMWNMSTEKVESRKRMERYEFLTVVSHEMLHYETPSLVSPPAREDATLRRVANKGDRQAAHD